VPSYDDLVEVGRHISFTERRADDAEKELRQVKILELLQGHVGDDFEGVVTGITNFGIFVQIRQYLIDGLIRYENLLDDWWDLNEQGGYIRGQRTGRRIGIGDVVTARVVRVDIPRRELDLAIMELGGHRGKGPAEASESRAGRPHGKQKSPSRRGSGQHGRPRSQRSRGH